MASSIDKAIAKLDQILLAAIGTAPAAPAAAAPTKSLPTSNSTGSASTSSLPAAAAPAAVKAAAGKAAAGKAAEGAREVLTTKAQIKVARIVSAEPLENSAKLLRLQADLGGGDTRQVMAGLAQFISPQQLAGSLVCVASNLKPAKLAGQPSEAMVLAAEAADAAGNIIVRTLLPPEGSQPGDLVHLDGSTC
uniref:tRNA-binding domain-containing protein n=1 Tax=Tetradesmus obliquus TaxID=3088 RepID=A0A383WHN4_TETOB|eukprot:jgi/Sobl393_1/8320/SZX76957.1